MCIVEGFATGATIHQATGYPVAVAFNAGNLELVAQAIRHKLPALPLIICADDDAGTEGNPGIAKANLAALATGAKVAVPFFGDQRPEGATDFNDMAALLGPEAVRNVIAGAGEPKKGKHQSSEENVPAGEYARDVNLTRASDVIPQPIAWLWNGWLAAGKMQHSWRCARHR